MIKMLHVIEQLSDFGGTPRKLLYLSRYLDKTRYKMTFLTYQLSELREQFETEGAEVINLDTLSPWKIGRGIANMARARRVDVICTHFTRPLITGVLAGRAIGLPVIHHEHAPCDIRQGVSGFLVKLAIPFANAVICNSNYTARRAASLYRLTPEKLHVIYNPIEERPLASGMHMLRNELGFLGDEVIIGHVGGMVPWRDQATLIKSFFHMHAKEPRLRLVLIGDGPVRQDLEALVTELNLTSVVHFIGYTDRIGDYLDAMDIYVNPALAEGFGIAVVEAMLAGLPVVLADAGAHPELISDGIDGLLYEAGKVDSLDSCLQALVADANLRARLGRAGRESARQRFAPQRYAQEYMRIVDATVAMKNQA